MQKNLIFLDNYSKGFSTNLTDYKQVNNFLINFGPQHPAAHGVLRLILNLDGEVISNADPHIGLLHRGTEKLMEFKTYNKSLPYLDRLDYVSTMAQEHCYALTIEYLLNYVPSQNTQILRVIFSEITRILNHLLAISCHALDVGAMTPFLWAFEDREKLMKIFEKVSGARLHTAYIRATEDYYETELSIEQLEEIQEFTLDFKFRLNDLETMLTNNRIWKQRLVNVGTISSNQAFDWSFSGVMLRGSGIPWDIRKFAPYDFYNNINLDIYHGNVGDSYDRYLIRINEMKMSIKIINQALSYYSYSQWLENNSSKIIFPDTKNSMESLIQHFKNNTEQISVPQGDLYFCIEAPKGEFGIYLIANSSNFPYRIKLKAPGFTHLQGLLLLGHNLTIADIVTIIGSQDIVFGEIDR